MWQTIIYVIFFVQEFFKNLKLLFVIHKNIYSIVFPKFFKFWQHILQPGCKLSILLRLQNNILFLQFFRQFWSFHINRLYYLHTGNKSSFTFLPKHHHALLSSFQRRLNVFFFYKLISLFFLFYITFYAVDDPNIVLYRSFFLFFLIAIIY